MGALIAELDRQGIRTKINGCRDGRKSGGIRFGGAAVLAARHLRAKDGETGITARRAWP
jgi:hypothetical protein